MLFGGSAVAWPLGARAQQGHRTPVIGVLMAGLESAPENQPRIAAFRQRLAELGWKDGENVHIEYRWSVGQRQLIDQYAKQLYRAYCATPVLGN
jgi:putative ABC transport system substrate-binding protein